MKELSKTRPEPLGPSTFIAPSGMSSPVLCGDETTVRERLGKGVSDLKLTRRYYTLSYPFPPSEMVEFFCLYDGSLNQEIPSLDNDGAKSLRQELEGL